MITRKMAMAWAGLLLVSGCGLSDVRSTDDDLWTLTEDGPDAGGTTDTGGRPDVAFDVGHNNPDVADTGPDVFVKPDVGPDMPPDTCLPSAPLHHRAGGAMCDDIRANPGPPPEEAQEWSTCTQHSDCTEGANGRCTGNAHDGWRCTYDTCFSDQDCGTGTVCECEGGFRSDNNVCLPGNCRTDADCGETGFCSPSFGACGDYSGVVGYFCHTCEDECVNDSDCGGTTDGWGDPYCMFEPGVSKWICSNSQCAG